MQTKFNRNYKIDFLKTMGLFLIILAHVNPPNIIFQIRNFDVILMIMISSFLYFNSNKQSNYFKYICKMFKRLVIPTWIFLAFYFLLNELFNFQTYSKFTIIPSFILNNGIGYVWIIRVYLIVAALLPLIDIVHKKYNNKIVNISILILYIAYEILCHYGFI